MINYKNLTPSVYNSGYNQTPNMTSAKTGQAVYGGGYKKPATTTTAWLPNLQKTIAPVPTPTPKPQVGGMSYAKPQMSVAPKVIQGSGMTPNYASNPTNYKPQKPVTVDDWMKTGSVDKYGRLNNFYDASEAKRTALANNRYQDTVALQNEMFNNANQDLKDQIPALDNRFSKFGSGVRENMAQADVIGQEQQANARTYTGEAQRTAMQNKRQTDAQREKQYAALGTIDSYGTGSFTQGNANADTEFNRDTQKRYDELARNLTEIDRTTASYKREALALIDTEKAKYEDAVKQINIQLRDNDVARRAAIKEAYYTTQEAINQISDQYEGLRISAEQDKLAFEQEMEKLKMPPVSDAFLQTGKPQTQEDFNFIYRNQTAATALQKMLGQNGGKVTEKGQLFSLAAQSAQQALDSLDSGMAGTGKGQSVSSWFGRMSGNMPAGQTDYETKLAAARGIALNALAGANVPPSEYKRLADMIPVLKDEPAVARQKLASFIEIMSSYGNAMNNTSTSLDDTQIASILQELQGM